MNTHQRGIYQPLAENVPIYDLTEEEDTDEERSRLPLLIVIGLIVMAAFTGVVWLAYNQGVERGRLGIPVIIEAQDGPVRTAPPEAGNASPLDDLDVYRPPVAPDQVAQSSNLASNLARSPAPPPPAANETPAIRPGPDLAPVTPVPVAPAASAPVVSPAALPAPVEAAPPSPPVTASAPVRGIFLQIGSYESAALAESAWKTFQTRHAEIIGSLSDNVQRADLGVRGIWYRLKAGPFADKSAAGAACEKLKAKGATCFVTAS